MNNVKSDALKQSNTSGSSHAVYKGLNKFTCRHFPGRQRCMTFLQTVSHFPGNLQHSWLRQDPIMGKDLVSTSCPYLHSQGSPCWQKSLSNPSRSKLQYESLRPVTLDAVRPGKR